ncbi:UDP-glucuronic acid decarboxylase family protein [Chelativorans sp. Marseille-P2723]|uniref:UDP-glucuronic acid decarboxylase family protein n=1 Tax=Chelativorans sp. Marseille-P2723 TaxID=2709133 RepID=UPI00156E952B|nr:UDP-glucuronic acid decarboxylase family protein [Chelativorans sp. Marseille-P2723]
MAYSNNIDYEVYKQDEKDERSSRRVLVTGGAGFLGSHLCEKLLKAGNSVICVDNFSTGRQRNIEHLIADQKLQVVSQDVRLPVQMDVDEIYNLASPASPPDYQIDPIQTLMTNVVGSLNVLELARQHGVKILQASTSEVYGDPLIHPQPETYWGNVNPFGPRACYDEGKRSAETLFFDYHRMHGVEIKIARIFNTYGPRMRADDGRVVSNFIVQALKGEPLTIYGNGRQTRSFCYVDDLVDGLVRLMASPAELNRPVNLGNPCEFTIRELAQQVIELTGSRSRIVFHPLPADDPQQRRPDISLAEQELDWRPTMALRNGLEHTIRYFDRLFSGAA